jgi:hypothetical protein
MSDWQQLRDPSPWSAMLERLMDLSIKVGGLKEHRDQANQRLAHLERQQSHLSIEIATLKTSMPTGMPSRALPSSKPPLIQHTQRFLPKT